MAKKKGDSYPDYDKIRNGSKNKKESEMRPLRLYILAGLIFVGGLLAIIFLDDLRYVLPERVYLTPFVILAFVLVWGFFLPDLIMQEVLHAGVAIPDMFRILSHVIYSYLLAWLLVEFLHQIETKESKKVLILTSALLALLVLIVTGTLIIFSLI
jgi:hypothetical protein